MKTIIAAYSGVLRGTREDWGGGDEGMGAGRMLRWGNSIPMGQQGVGEGGRSTEKAQLYLFYSIPFFFLPPAGAVG